jgi:hypothetical protein
MSLCQGFVAMIARANITNQVQEEELIILKCISKIEVIERE